MTVPSLNHEHARVLREIFAHPIAHNLEWKDVVSLFAHLGSVQERHDGKYEFAVGTAQAIFHKPHGKDVDADDVERLRHLLRQAGIDESGVQTPPAEASATSRARVIVAIDHHVARFFSSDASGHLVEQAHLEPADPHGFERHLEHRKEADYRGERVPEPTEYYERVAQRLRPAGSILLLGDATGKSSAMNFLVEYIQRKHPDIWHHVVGTDHVDLSSLTIAEIQQINARFKQTV